MKDIKIGSSAEKSITVTEENLALTVGSGSLRVFATPMMTAIMENAADATVQEYLDEGETTVGTYLAVSHISATPFGMKVCALATVISVNGREIEFKVEASDEIGKIGEGTHKRFVVNTENFMRKTNGKR